MGGQAVDGHYDGKLLVCSRRGQKRRDEFILGGRNVPLRELSRDHAFGT